MLLLWTAPHASPRCRALLPSPAQCLAFSQDGRFVATGHADGTVRVHRTPQLPWHPPDAAGKRGTRLELVAVSGAPTDQGGSTAAAAAAAAAAPSHAEVLECIAFSANGAASVLIACGGHDRTIRVLELRFDHRPDQHDDAYRLGDGPSTGLAPPRADRTLTRRLGGALIPRLCCRGHLHTVTHLDFSADGAIMMSNCAGREVILWALPSGQRIPQPGRLATDSDWLAQTCVLGFDRMGIWGLRPDGSLISSINSAHVIHAAGKGGLASKNIPFNDSIHPLDKAAAASAGGGRGGLGTRVGAAATTRQALATPGMLPREHTYNRSGLVLTAGDDGDVRLLRAPCLVHAAPAKDGLSHCDRVASARFLDEGKGAVSAGRSDLVVVRWEVVS